MRGERALALRLPAPERAAAFSDVVFASLSDTGSACAGLLVVDGYATLERDPDASRLSGGGRVRCRLPARARRSPMLWSWKWS